jgi:hypothetical protein
MAKRSLPSVFSRALGKVFAECPVDPRQKSDMDGDKMVTESLLSAGTARHSAKTSYFFLKKSLPCATLQALGKVLAFFLKNALPCRHSAKVTALLSAMTNALGEACS